MRIKAKSRSTLIALIAVCLILPQTSWAQRSVSVEESPSAGAMVGDLVVARPAGLVITAAGTVAFLVSLPFTLLAGNATDAAETLMIGPAKATFVRCLGCRESGYSYRDIDKNNERKERKAKEEAEAMASAE